MSRPIKLEAAAPEAAPVAANSAIKEYSLVLAPSRRSFHVMSFPQNDFNLDKLNPPVQLTRAQGPEKRKARVEEIDPSIAPFSGTHRLNRAFQPKTRAVYSDMRSAQEVAEAERERNPWMLRDHDGRLYEGQVSSSVANYVVFMQDMDEWRVVPIKKWYNFIGQRQGKPMSMEEIEELHKRKLLESGFTMKAGGVKTEDESENEIKRERRERQRQETREQDELIGEGEWDYTEQDADILEDAGEDTLANLKSGYEQTAEEVQEQQMKKFERDKGIKELLKEERRNERSEDEESSPSESDSEDEEDSDSDDSDGSDEEPSDDEEEASSSNAPPPSASKKRAAETSSPSSSAMSKRIKTEGSPAPSPPAADSKADLLLLTKAEVRRMWRQPVTYKDFAKNFRARCKQHPQNATLLAKYVGEMFVQREVEGQKKLFLASS